MASIQEKLKAARLAAGLTQEAVAEKVGVSRQTISNWENGKSYPDIISVLALSDLYQLSLDALLKGDSEMIEHLKKTTDVVKSNKRLALSLLTAGALALGFVLVRLFVPIPKIGGTLPNLLAVLLFAIGLVVVLAATVDLKKLAQGKTSNKTLLLAGFVLLYALLYIPLVLFVPGALGALLSVQTSSAAALIRALTASLLLIPAPLIFQRLKRLSF